MSQICDRHILIYQMKLILKIIISILSFQVSTLVFLYIAVQNVEAGGSSHKKILIHVPLAIKQHHHTHTIYKHIKHHDYVPRGDSYKLSGYSYGDGGYGNGGYGSFGSGSSYAPTSLEDGWQSGGYGGFLNNHYDESSAWIDDRK